MNISCKTVEDLLPLYHDGVCSQESRRIVENHLAQCQACRDFLARLDGELVYPGATDKDLGPLKSIQSTVSRGRKKALFVGISATLALLLILLSAWSIRWYTREYRYYAAFAEGHTPLSVNEYGADGSILQSIVIDKSQYCWQDDTYRYTVTLPGFLSRNGDMSMQKKDGKEGWTVDVGIGRWYDAEYVYHISFIRESTDDSHYFIVDSSLNLIYLDHWSESYKKQVKADLENYREEVLKVIADAKETWTFLP